MSLKGSQLDAVNSVKHKGYRDALNDLFTLINEDPSGQYAAVPINDYSGIQAYTTPTEIDNAVSGLRYNCFITHLPAIYVRNGRVVGIGKDSDAIHWICLERRK